ncbi:hypothetical protein HK101_001851 [Irineochytrium annulatum]|nr:hypothetical protein HK101_001851 [Irineochytrium annulatum]
MSSETSALNPVDTNAGINLAAATDKDLKKAAAQQPDTVLFTPEMQEILNRDDDALAARAAEEAGIADAPDGEENAIHDDDEGEDVLGHDDEDDDHEMDEDNEEDKMADTDDLDPKNILPTKTRGVKIDYKKVDPEAMAQDDDDIEADPDVVIDNDGEEDMETA